MKKYALLVFMHISLSAQDIILWDLHQVVLNRSINSTLRALLNANMIHAISNLTWNQLGELIILSFDNLIHEKSGEEYIYIARKANNPALVNAIITVANAWEIMPGIEPIIKELNQLGIEQDIGSNIGRTAFDQLVKEPRFASIFSYMNLKRSQVVEFNTPQPIQKPNPLFFEEYLKKNNLSLKKTRIIFIDDKKVNVTAAREMGLVAIHFKNTDQLRTDLRELGIHLSPAQKQVHLGYKYLFE